MRRDRQVRYEVLTMQNPPLPVSLIGITGKKNSGKTTVVEGLVRELTGRGLKVCTIKHHYHDTLDIDIKGTDSYRHYEAGAAGVIIASTDKTGYFERVEGDNGALESLIGKFPADTSLVLMEGYHKFDVPRIEVSRKSLSTELMPNGGKPLIAVVADYAPVVDVPFFPLTHIMKSPVLF